LIISEASLYYLLVFLYSSPRYFNISSLSRQIYLCSDSFSALLPRRLLSPGIVASLHQQLSAYSNLQYVTIWSNYWRHQDEFSSEYFACFTLMKTTQNTCCLCPTTSAFAISLSL
jgi:hypothetical protein